VPVPAALPPDPPLDAVAGAPSRLPAEHVTTADGVRIAMRHDPRTGGADGDERDLAVVLGHGFTGTWRRPEMRAIARVLAESAGVLSLDFRGHGGSGGCTTLGRDEVLDVAAVVGHARGLGYRRVATLGFSMGAGVVVRHAALQRGVDAVVAVSGPARWNYRGTRAMRIVNTMVNTRAGRWALATVRGTRVCPDMWDPLGEPPDAVAGRIAPVPLLVVHGDADHYFPLEHARWLARAAGPTATLWELPGFGHAESWVTPDLARRMARWVAERATPTGSEPPSGSARMRT
jgi:pimeloyl-ACP methyl ester carboxylesterase